MTNAAELETFRADLRAWLGENLPKALGTRRQASLDEGAEEDVGDDAKLWAERMGARAWGLPTLAQTYGGAGLSVAQAQILREELANIRAPNPLGGMGVGMLAPVLIEFGDEAQKRRFLPPIARGEVRWCQGFSEPGAGSDLAGCKPSARTRAIIISSTARKSGPAAPIARIGASASCARTQARSMKAFRCC